MPPTTSVPWTIGFALQRLAGCIPRAPAPRYGGKTTTVSPSRPKRPVPFVAASEVQRSSGTTPTDASSSRIRQTPEQYARIRPARCPGTSSANCFPHDRADPEVRLATEGPRHGSAPAICRTPALWQRVAAGPSCHPSSSNTDDRVSERRQHSCHRAILGTDSDHSNLRSGALGSTSAIRRCRKLPGCSYSHVFPRLTYLQFNGQFVLQLELLRHMARVLSCRPAPGLESFPS
jgi:hypothetical protein